MCLKVNENAKRQTAKEDIVCYKRLRECKNIVDLSTSNYGDDFEGFIRGSICSGKISIVNNRYYFCTNASNLDGNYCEDKLNFQYSWELDESVEKIIINGIELPKKDFYITPYRNVNIEIGETYTSKLEKPLFYEINIGIHSFCDLIDAKNDGGDVYAKCIIPKGSEYYEGTFCDCSSYASNTIKYLELIK
jgi:hypothetical protein